MKKIYSLLAISTLVVGASAQQLQTPPVLPQGTFTEVKSLEFDRTENLLKGATSDTTGLSSSGNFVPVFAGSPGILGNQGGGYVFGSKKDTIINGTAIATNAFAQGYENLNNSTAEIKEVLVWFFAKYDAGNNGSVKVRVYEMADNRATSSWTGFTGTADLDKEGPKASALIEVDLLVADIDSSSSFGLTSIPMPSPVSVNGNFAIEIDAYSFTTSADTIGVVSDDGSNGMEYVFMRIGAGYYWGTSEASYGASLSNNTAVFAVIGDNNVGIESNEFYNGVQLSAFPNPATVSTTISFNLEKSFNNVKVNIMDAQGRIVNRIEKGALSAGLYNEVMEVSSLSAGKYYYTIYADNTKLTKSFNVVK